MFLTIAGYTEREVLGQPHSMIRHPDMPRGVFALLWETIASGSEIFAYVVNLAKNGDHYWVFAHVTPTFPAISRRACRRAKRTRTSGTWCRASIDCST